MNLRHFLVALAALFFAAAPAKAQLLFEENFDYTAGSTLVGQGGWTRVQTTTTNPITVVSPGLDLVGYPNVIGNSVALTNTGEDVARGFTSQASGTVYMSALVSVSAVTGAGDYFLSLGSNPATPQFNANLFARSATGGYNLGIERATSGATYAGDVLQFNQTYLVVLSYQIVAGTANDVARLYIFEAGDDFSAQPGTPDAQSQPSTRSDVSIGAVALRQGSTTPNATVDGIRVATSWDQLFPDPTGFTLVQPTAGQVFRTGSYLKPVWTSAPADAVGLVRVTLRQGGSDVAVLYEGLNPRQPQFGVVRYLIPAVTPAGLDYTVRVESLDNPAVFVESAQFTIERQAVIVTGPAAQDTLQTGALVNVTFQTEGVGAPASAKVYLRQVGVAGGTFLARENETNGFISATLPETLPSGDYFVIVRVNDGTNSFAGKSEVFYVEGEPAPPRMPLSRFVVEAPLSNREAYLSVGTAGLGGEVGVFADGVLVGASRVAGPVTEVVVRGENLADGAALTLRHFDGVAETAMRTVSVLDAAGGEAVLAFEDLAELTIETAKGDVLACDLTVSASPNPATTSAAVRFTVGTSTAATVSVYDLLGRRVATAFDAVAEAGTTEVSVSTSALPAGVYVVRVTAGAENATTRLTIVR